MKDKDPEYLTTLERGLTVLRSFNKSRPEMQLSEVAAATNLSPAVARRCLNTLVALGYVTRAGKKFLLTPEVLVFGSAFLALEETLKDKDPEYLTTLERGLTVLRSFNKSRPEMQLSEVAAATNLSPAVARRCLNTLVALGYVTRAGKKFLLTPEVLVFGSAFLASASIDSVIGEHLQSVRDETGDSSSISVLSGEDILYLAHIPTNRHIRLNAGVGTRFPAHATSMGKVMLAHLPEDKLADYLEHAELKRFTDLTVTSPETLKKQLVDIRSKGYCSVLSELDYGLVSIAVPVYDDDGSVLAAINCSTAASRIAQDELVRTRLPLLKQASQQIQQSLNKWPVLLHSLLRL